METLSRLIAGRKAKRVTQARVPTDEILPVFFFDDTPMLRNAVMCWTMRFNDVLDPEKLHQSLARLLERGDGWRKLRGRIRLNQRDKLEIHVPQPSTPERPALTFSHVSFETSIDEHPLASKLPRPTQSPSLQANHGDFKSLGISPNAPRTIDDYLTTDAPQLSLHIVSFTDATLVSLTWPHISSDGVGLRDLVEAWSLILAGHDDKVLPMMTACTEDPMATAGLDPNFQEKHILEKHHMKGWRILVWGLRYLLDIVWWPRMETRTVYLPREACEKMRTDAMASLQAAARHGPGMPTPFISDGDAIAAWISCMAAKELSASSTRSVVILTPVDVRSRMPSLFPVKQTEGVYILNAAPIVSTIINAQDMLSGDDAIAKTAQCLRRSLRVQTSEGQLHALNRHERISIAENGLPAFFGDMSSFVVILSNMTKAQFVEKLDFGPAVIHKGTGSSRLKERWAGSSDQISLPGRMVYYHMQGLGDENIFMRNNFFLFGMPGGDYWINGSLPPAIWRKVRDSFSSIYVEPDDIHASANRI
ncbi:transcriptional regulator sdnM [Hirsutella rhossiliensis]|uniref:Transcriptional regulator sdnM n=1 Tax=Hirsutella rhossiliensis TaxID=111463 RepID=A0A9P8SK39_9HYPO|nr:transcriptional regulator sdnM [Hirsutella rhossiliensis]KAH0965536.1 transcriptional regulator sdnM [Hirsutella rhossiliensis]